MITNQGRETPSLGGFPYQVQHFIDAGSKMSDILLAVDRKNRPVVLKIACVDQRTRADVNRMAIKNTIKWLRRLGRHRGMIALRAIEETGAPRWRWWFARRTYCAVLEHWPGQPEFLVMDYLVGGSLRDFVDGKRPGLQTSLWIAHQVARTLAYIHSQGCVHRDLKPENILFRAPPDANANPASVLPILIDFGVAAQAGEERLVSGSRLWMAPELQEAYERHPLPVDPAWDVYALGLILCYMIGGSRPQSYNFDVASYESFREQTFARIDRAAGGAAPTSAAIKMSIKQLIDKTLERAPAKRISAQAFAAESAQLMVQMGAPFGVREGLLMRMEQNRRLAGRPGKLLGMAAAALLGLCLIVLVGFAAQRGQLVAGFAMPSGDQSVPVGESDVATGALPDQAQMAGADASPNLFTVVNSDLGSRPGDARLASTPPAMANVAAAAATTLSPEPTRVRLTPTPTQPAPTRIALTPPPTNPPPTLALPSPTATATEAVTVPATATPRAQPTNPVRPTTTRTPTVTPPETPGPLGEVQLLAPESKTRSNQTKVEFSWQITQRPLASDQCFELVFWDPANPVDRRSPVGAGKVATGRVDFGVLATTQDPLLSKLAQSNQEFRWGVRLVSCTSPKTVVREVEEERVYTYDSQ